MKKETLQSLKPIYPIHVQKYNEFIPKPENENFISKLNSVIDYLTRIGSLNNQTVKQWNEVMKWLTEEGLEHVTQEEFEKLYEDKFKEDFETSIEEVTKQADFAETQGMFAKEQAEKSEEQYERLKNTSVGSLSAQINLKADKTEVNQKIAQVASGSPKGTYSTLSSLQSAKPSGDTGIYIVSADGKWYYWNGSSWVSGGTYQSTGLSEGSATRTVLTDNFMVNPTLQPGTDLNVVSKDGTHYGAVNSNFTNVPPDFDSSKNLILTVKAVIPATPLRFIIQELQQFGDPSKKWVRQVDLQPGGTGTTAWVKTNLIGSGTVGTTELANASVTSIKYADKSIVQAKLHPYYSFVNSYSTGDVNTFTSSGLYLITGQLSNMPTGASTSGYLKVDSYNTFVLQEFIELSNMKKVYRRTIRPANNVFNVWDDVSVSTTVSPFKGKKAVHFGDSFIEFGTTPQQIGDKLGMTVYNIGFGGTRMAKHEPSPQGLLYNEMCMYRLADYVNKGDYTNLLAKANELKDSANDNNVPIVERLMGIDFNTVDYVIISYGQNDFAGSTPIPIGTNDDMKSDGSTFKGAINYSIQQLQSKYPHLKLIFTTPTYRSRYTVTGDGLDSDQHPNPSGKYLVDFANAIIEVAHKNHIPVIDLHRTSGFNKYTAPLYISTDGLHPSTTGYSHLASKIASGLTKEFM